MIKLRNVPAHFRDQADQRDAADDWRRAAGDRHHHRAVRREARRRRHDGEQDHLRPVIF